MKDRSVEFPNRYRLTKVAGTDDIYDLVPAPGDVTEEGTYINKATLLKDTTAALFGLDENAVPDDVLQEIGRVSNWYVWNKESEIKTLVPDVSTTVTSVSVNADTVIYYSDEIAVTNDELQLVNALTVTPAEVADLNALVAVFSKKYVKVPSVYDNVFYAAGGGSASGTWPNGSIVISLMSVDYHYEYSYTNVGYVNSPDPNAYPVDDGYIYTALGQLGEKVRIATGSYTGTDKSGSDNPNTLTFDFEPKLLVVSRSSGLRPQSGYWDNSFIWTHGQTTVQTGSSATVYVTFTQNGNSLSWYYGMTGEPAKQLNSSTLPYHYIAIG